MRRGTEDFEDAGDWRQGLAPQSLPDQVYYGLGQVGKVAHRLILDLAVFAIAVA
jgi:hypothetical protein